MPIWPGFGLSLCAGDVVEILAAIWLVNGIKVAGEVIKVVLVHGGVLPKEGLVELAVIQGRVHYVGLC